MSDDQTTERELEREDRRLQRLRLVVGHAVPEETADDDADPDPKEAA